MSGKLQNVMRFSGKKYADPRLVYLLGLFGLLLVVAAGWLWFSDSTATRATERALEQGNRVLELVMEPVESLKSVLADEQVQTLALRAIDRPETTDELLAGLQERAAQVVAVTVYDTDEISRLDATITGVNGYAILDMALSALEGKQSLMQVHGVLNPPLLFDAVPLRSGEDVVGVMIISAEPSFLLQAFEPQYSALGYVRLSQYNGRQPATVLKELGDSSQMSEVPERLAVPGTIFRVEYPQARYIGAISGNTLVLMLMVGFICVLAAYALLRNNKKQIASGALAEPEKAWEPVAMPSEPVMPAHVQEPDADFVDEAIELEGQAGLQPPPVPETGPPALHLHYDIAERRRMQEAEHPPVELKPEIFRAYDIRGVIDKTLDSGIARQIGQAVGSQVLERRAGPVVVARDGRLSGPYLMEGVIEGILSTGCDVLDIGAAPTGVLYYATYEFAKGSAIMITGSHNPPDYNGFKVMVGGDTLHGDAIMALYQRIVDDNLESGEGSLEKRDVIEDYINRIVSDVQIEKPLRVVLDCGNGIGGLCAPEVLRAVGVEVLPLYDEVDGTFPNHHPDPSEPENLQDLIESVRLMDADLGLALDGDADRLGVVTLAGDIIYPDKVLMLLALDVLDRVPGATILYDVKCTGDLAKVIRQAGGNPVMYKTGHSLMKAKMKEIGCPFAGEMSGHFFFGERWYGVDDGIYAAARLLEILGGTETPPEAILNALPSSFSTPELKVQMEEGENHVFVEAFKEAFISASNTSPHFDGAEINTIDGIRVDFKDGFGLLRASNTTPILIVRFDADSEAALERIKSLFRRQMLTLNPDLSLPF
ncbi:MAG: phosphomannomutase/phosphoglucomutase [Xanthomonadales bacterium]|jgi:phosphomannomutase/phosphoglucomutase|nr:phosphomannomutase/phosphoglucomutase [Xanthomonadales bacterium]